MHCKANRFCAVDDPLCVAYIMFSRILIKLRESRSEFCILLRDEDDEDDEGDVA